MGQSTSRVSSLNAGSSDVEKATDELDLSVEQPAPSQAPIAVGEDERFRNREDRVNIQPHTDDGGDAYYIGDAYEPAKCATEWAIDT